MYRYLLLLLLFLSEGCNSFSQKIRTPIPKYVYNQYGILEGYQFDSQRPKVVTYMYGIGLTRVYFSSTILINGENEKFMQANPEFEYLFYICGIHPNDENDLLALLKKCTIDYPVFFDYGNEFLEANKGLSLFGTLSGWILGADNTIYGGAPMGQRLTMFPSQFILAKKNIQTDHNGL
uniref:hypothetical protein n=1 Tax=Alistipes sp. D31t1_170403_E11 TaxID=2787128 RepID=UPI001897D7F6|nr:hypothetical protein [Alistipes sp. D31t1_170403_E11]